MKSKTQFFSHKCGRGCPPKPNFGENINILQMEEYSSLSSFPTVLPKKSHAGRPKKTAYEFLTKEIKLEEILDKDKKLIMRIDLFANIPIFFCQLTEKMNREKLKELELISDNINPPGIWMHLSEKVFKVGECQRKKFWMILLEQTTNVLFWHENLVRDICDLMITYDKRKFEEKCFLFQDDLHKLILNEIRERQNYNFKLFNRLLNEENKETEKKCEEFIKNLIRCFEDWKAQFNF